MSFRGKVCLVGAGPGDPGLLTVKALKRLKEADLIIYDYLANPEHLRHAKPSAQKIGVGKGFRYKALSQKKINEIIVRAARSGKNVVRLKGGDPYLFGRGGEEAAFLFERRIPFEVVPGVTSATACAAYAGVPLTHREHNASVTFLTGHRAHDEGLDTIAWDKIVSLGGTVVVYMGFYNLGRIAAQLVRHGMFPATRVCVVEWGTLPRQRSCDGTLADIEEKVKRLGLGAPCIIIIGDVVSMRGKLDWFERLPLFGKTVVVTRMKEKASRLGDRLKEAGAETVDFPVIEIRPLPDYRRMDAAIRKLADFDWMVFTSVHGVEAFFRRLAHLKKDARWLSGVKVASVGCETSRALVGGGVRPDLEPARFETRALVSEFRKRPGKRKKVLLLRTDIAPPELEKGLKKLGFKTTTVAAYLTRPAKNDAKTLLKRNLDYVTFTSSSTVTNFVKALGLANARRIARSARLASIGPVTSTALRRFGFKPRCQAKIFTVDGLADAIIKDAQKR